MSSEFDDKNRKQNEPGQTDREKSAGGRQENPQGSQTEREEGQGGRPSQTPGGSGSGRSGESETE